MFPKQLLAMTLIVIAGLATNAHNDLAAADSDSQLKTSKADAYYEGPWVTTKTKQLNGILTCRIEQLTPGHWRGRFWGTWQQVPLDYTVDFALDSDVSHTRTVAASEGDVAPAGIPVAGKATIDGAFYEWKGQLAPDQFKIQFTGSRYEGHLDLKRIAEKTPPAQEKAPQG